jgi:hypothetical protein
VGAQLLDQSVRQDVRFDVLRGFAAAAHVGTALEIAGRREDQRTAAGGAADDAGEPVLLLVGRPAVIVPAGFDVCHALLHGLPELRLDQGLVAAVGDDHAGGVEVPTAAAVGIPADLADIDGVAQDVFNSSVFKLAASVGALAVVVHPLGQREETFSLGEAQEELANVGSLDGMGDEGAPLIRHRFANR